VGISIGLGRLGMWMVEQEPWKDYAATPADVYVAYGLGNVASKLRAAGLKVEEGLEDKPLGKQLMQAEKRGLKCAITKFNSENNILTLRDLTTRSDTDGDYKLVVKHLDQLK
jgi:histidyl-tRNA synthetase